VWAADAFDAEFGGRIRTRYSTGPELKGVVKRADVVIGATGDQCDLGAYLRTCDPRLANGGGETVTVPRELGGRRGSDRPVIRTRGEPSTLLRRRSVTEAIRDLGRGQHQWPSTP
jgi:hypothetical protein